MSSSIRCNPLYHNFNTSQDNDIAPLFVSTNSHFAYVIK
jgi:hypothetical protein